MRIFILIILCAAALCVPCLSGQETPDSEAPDTGVILSIDECITTAVLYNRDIAEAFISYRKTLHEISIDRSRFLPNLDVEYGYSRSEHESSGTDSRDRSTSVVYSQRLMEFGRENSADVYTREAVREKFYSLQSAIANVVSNVRRDFFYILLKQKQIRERVLLLKEFREDFVIAKAKHEKGQILEIDVFSAELNVLNEELRLNELKRSLLKRKMDLRYRLGCRVPLEFGIRGEREPLDLSEKEAVSLAKGRDFYLDRLKEEIYEKEREVAEKVWEYLPQLTFQMGYENLKNNVAVSLSQSGYMWGVDLEAETFILPPSTREAVYPDRDMEDVSFGFQIRLPLFDGFKKREEQEMEKKELRILRLRYRDSMSALVRDVLKAYQDYYEQKEQLGITKRRLYISKKRFEINERLKEFGRIDDNQLETFRQAFFSQQNALYTGQDVLIRAEEDIRKFLFDPDSYMRMLKNPEPFRRKLLEKHIGPYCEGVPDEE